MIDMIVSGGQTGADRGALDAALKLGIKHGGWIPKGRITEQGPLPMEYQLKEMETNSYTKRTEQNVIDSDGTLILSHGPLTGGSALTQEFAQKHGRPVFHVDLIETPAFNAVTKINDWIGNHDISVLNVAGPRASKDPMIYKATMDIIEAVYYMGFIHADLQTGGVQNVMDSKKPENTYPQTIEEAVSYLVSRLSLKDRITIANMQESELMTLNQTLGVYIIEKCGLLSQNTALIELCRRLADSDQLDEYAMAEQIILALWKHLKQTHILRVVK